MPECQLVERHIDGGLAVLEGAKTALPDSSEDLLRDLFSARVRVLSHNVAAQGRQTMVLFRATRTLHFALVVLAKVVTHPMFQKMVLEPMLEHAGGEVELFARLRFQSFVCLALSARQRNPISTIILGRMEKSEGASPFGLEMADFQDTS